MERVSIDAALTRLPDPTLSAMRSLVEWCSSWPLVRALVEADAERWPLMKDMERVAAFERTSKRVALVAPEALGREEVRQAFRTMGLPPSALNVAFQAGASSRLEEDESF
jgi:hypothetical protein